jgi:hypothetical protein
MNIKREILRFFSVNTEFIFTEWSENKYFMNGGIANSFQWHNYIVPTSYSGKKYQQNMKCSSINLSICHVCGINKLHFPYKKAQCEVLMNASGLIGAMVPFDLEYIVYKIMCC